MITQQKLKFWTLNVSSNEVSLKATTVSSYNCFGYCRHFHILEKMSASLGRVLSVILGEWVSGLCHFDQNPLGTQLGVETQPLLFTSDQKLIANMQWLTSSEWDCFLSKSQKLAMEQPNNRLKNSRDKEQIIQSFQP